MVQETLKDDDFLVCPACRQVSLDMRPTCWFCGESLDRSIDQAVKRGDSSRDSDLVKQGKPAAAAALVVFVIVLIGLLAAAPGLGIVVVIWFVPFVLRAAISKSPGKSPGKSPATRAIQSTSLSLGATVVVGIAGFVSFCAFCYPAGFVGMAVMWPTMTGERKGDSAFLGSVVFMSVIGFGVFGAWLGMSFVARRFRRWEEKKKNRSSR